MSNENSKVDDEKTMIRRKKKLKKETILKMQSANTYRDYFDTVVESYVECLYQHEVLLQQFYDGGCKIVEVYTNKAGFENERKTALYQSLETLRKDILAYSTQLGLTPSGLKKINDEMNGKRKASKLDKALCKIGT